MGSGPAKVGPGRSRRCAAPRAGSHGRRRNAHRGRPPCLSARPPARRRPPPPTRSPVRRSSGGGPDPASATVTRGLPATVPTKDTVPAAMDRTRSPVVATKSTPRWPADHRWLGGEKPAETSGESTGQWPAARTRARTADGIRIPPPCRLPRLPSGRCAGLGTGDRRDRACGRGMVPQAVRWVHLTGLLGRSGIRMTRYRRPAPAAVRWSVPPRRGAAHGGRQGSRATARDRQPTASAR